MSLSLILYRLTAFLRHRLSAWNTGGEGIHSPYLFYLVRMVLSDRHPYYIWSDIEYRRTCMLRAPKLVSVLDYGTGSSGERLVSDIAAHSLESKHVGQLLFRLANHLTSSAYPPLRVVELGTSLGISTAYLAAADSRAEITTFEGAPALLEIARMNWQKLQLKNISAVEGNIDETLPAWLQTHPEPIDLAYIDANHTYEATLRYWSLLAERTQEKSIIVLDDIHYSPEMERAWKTIQQDKRVTSTMDLYNVGLVFFDPHYLVKHYILRI